MLPVFTLAQITDNFSDGDFTNNPTWSGDAGQFIVNASQQLQLNSSGTGSSYLAVATSLPTLDNTEWQFYIKLNFAPSSSNNGRVYLVSDQQNLKGSLNGYYLQFGENLANDAIELFRQTGTTSTSVARGTNGFIAAAFTIRIKVTRNNAGLWSILADATAGSNFALQATGTDVTYNTGNYFGVVCNYTTTNATNFFFDDFSIPNIADVFPPTISTAAAISNAQVDVKFSEPVSLTTAQLVSNYTVNNSIGSPSSAVRDASDFSLVHLSFANTFTSGLLNTITINNVQDFNGNSIVANSTITFTYTAPAVAQPYDIIINEIYYEPIATAPLPNVEFVELFNRSAGAINLNGWKLTDGSTSVATIGNVIINPGSFLIVCKSTDAALLAPFGTVAGTSSFPSLNNDVGDDLRLQDNTGLQIDRVMFNDNYYNNNSKKNGGFTIERIDPDFICDNRYNWSASNDATGGTPGRENSVKGSYADNIAPQLLSAYPASATQIEITFTETPDPGFASLNSSYTISNGIGQPATVIINDTKVILTIGSPLQAGIIYTITVSGSIQDCPGNLIAGNRTVRIALPETVTAGNLIINEILFNPKSGGNDFVELYNNSNKVIDLKNLKIATTDDNDVISTNYAISDNGYLVFPGDYVAITTNVENLIQFYPVVSAKNCIQASLPGFNDDKGVCVLTDFALNRFDQLAYDKKWHYPLIDDQNGVSLERLSFNRPTQDAGNWHSAVEKVGFATPGYRNSQAVDDIDAGSELNVDPEVFSPDNDGYNDVVSFYINMNDIGYLLNADIYNEDGRLVKRLVKAKLLAPQDAFTWDGINEKNEKASVGIYIVFAEVYNPKGNVKKFKKTFVLATKL